MSVLVDTSGLVALINPLDDHASSARRYWMAAVTTDHVAHAYVVVEAVALVRRRMGWPGVDALAPLLEAIRVEVVDRDLHDTALTAYVRERGGTSLVDCVSIEFARRNGIYQAFAFDSDLFRAGLRFPDTNQGVLA